MNQSSRYNNVLIYSRTKNFPVHNKTDSVSSTFLQASRITITSTFLTWFPFHCLHVYAQWRSFLCSYSVFVQHSGHIKPLICHISLDYKHTDGRPCLIITKSLLFPWLIGLSTVNMEISPSLSSLCTYTRSLTSYHSEVDSGKENGRWHQVSETAPNHNPLFQTLA